MSILDKHEQIASRKKDHILLCSTDSVNSHVTTHLEDITLIKTCFPQHSLSSIDISTDFYGTHLSAPIIIGAMSGGSSDVISFNKALGTAANATGVAIGVGSQRSGLETKDEGILESYRVIRECAPRAFIIGNIGAVQLTESGDVLDELLDMVRGNAMAVHLNWEQELSQPEGDREMYSLSRLEEIIKNWGGIVIGKQVGHGMTKHDGMICRGLGMKCVDVGGLGGTSFAAVEALRVNRKLSQLNEVHSNGKDLKKDFQSVGHLLWDYGIPTAMSLSDCCTIEGLDVIAGGGIRNGMEIVKCLSYGSIACSIARPFVSLALNGSTDCITYIEELKKEISSVMFLTNSKTLKDTRNIDKIISGDLSLWQSHTFLEN
ncbi:isopentenyl-diphosphate delta-isomerase, putative [Entamoeba invadens IP1]|uniref:isopentenyl-diphosphate delta-isomerase, putative n=1 Tax=Entamoeba invadens IP1 TaxID=370355 RepID=UPI0002C3DB37|nr:isopentenyl-diphosphate delta-isomerase, putative [Entamoeba invadens IP1]ELP93811.1 isopentenyl-diphosphate delta-isomerase, putative [Entamoeba invadens IP1]|eukprot:XP_004260582.1 isopentenyl-diphosphate delta-isomerase, putative [Entamoeba invadens IP1]